MSANLAIASAIIFIADTKENIKAAAPIKVPNPAAAPLKAVRIVEAIATAATAETNNSIVPAIESKPFINDVVGMAANCLIGSTIKLIADTKANIKAATPMKLPRLFFFDIALPKLALLIDLVLSDTATTAATSNPTTRSIDLKPFLNSEVFISAKLLIAILTKNNAPTIDNIKAAAPVNATPRPAYLIPLPAFFKKELAPLVIPAKKLLRTCHPLLTGPVCKIGRKPAIAFTNLEAA